VLYAAERQPGPVTPVACRAHVRRKFHDVHAARQSSVTQEAPERNAALHAVEKATRGRLPDERRQVRQKRSRPVAKDLLAWMEITVPKLSGPSDMAAAMHYARVRQQSLLRYLDDGWLTIGNNAAERALRGIALGRKNYLFSGSDAVGERAAAIYSLIETVGHNGLDRPACLADVIARFGPHPACHLADLLLYHWQPTSCATIRIRRLRRSDQ
jgi:hypothetical protein